MAAWFSNGPCQAIVAMVAADGHVAPMGPAGGHGGCLVPPVVVVNWGAVYTTAGGGVRPLSRLLTYINVVLHATISRGGPFQPAPSQAESHLAVIP